jgi:hypothetical protein
MRKSGFHLRTQSPRIRLQLTWQSLLGKRKLLLTIYGLDSGFIKN